MRSKLGKPKLMKILSRSSSTIFLAGLLLVVACAPVRQIESHDRKIEQGMPEYQEPLQAFVQQTLADYEFCHENQIELGLLQQMQCGDGSAEVRRFVRQKSMTIDNVWDLRGNRIVRPRAT